MKNVYSRWTADEVRTVEKSGKVALLPLGTLEQHGPHLPLDTDTRIANAIAWRVAQLVPETVVLLRPLEYGVSSFHREPPGGIYIHPHVYENFLLAIIESMIAHGFGAFFLLNGHGGNQSSVTNVQKIINHGHERKVFVGTTPLYLSGAKGRAALREEGFRETIGHACEIETSLMLAIDAAVVRMDKIADDEGFHRTTNFSPYDDGPLQLYLPTETESRDGVYGNPSKASPEAGGRLLAIAAEEIGDYIKEMLAILEKVRRQLRRIRK
ncbi:MAG: creatininase family protein [Patescibacteria group bacterium]